MTPTSQTQELKHRVAAKKKELEAKLKEAQADSAAKGRESASELKKSLDNLKEIVPEKWDDVREGAAEKLNTWLSNN